jgi:hypothetical protein
MGTSGPILRSPPEVNDHRPANRQTNQGAWITPRDRIGGIADKIHDENAEREPPSPRPAHRQTVGRSRAGRPHDDHQQDRVEDAHLLKSNVRRGIQPPDHIERPARKEQRDNRHGASGCAKREKPREQPDPDRPARWCLNWRLHLVGGASRASAPVSVVSFRKRFGVCKGRMGESFTGVERERIISLIVGVTLGAVSGAVIESRQPALKSIKPYVLSVDQRTGKPHLHVRGKPELE